MAENPGLENHRIKSFKNKGRDVEVSVLPRSGSPAAAPAPRRWGRAGGRRRESARRLAVGQSWPPPPVTGPRAGRSGRRHRGRLQPPLRSRERAGREMPWFSAPSRGRGLLSARKGCGAEAGSAGRGLAGPGWMLPPGSVSRTAEGVAAARASGRRYLPPARPPRCLPRCRTWSLGCAGPRAYLLRAGPRRAVAPAEGLGTSRVTDLLEGGGWGRVGCARTIFLYSRAVLWTSRAELTQLILLLPLAVGAS